MGAMLGLIPFHRQVLECLPTAPCDVTVAELADDLLDKTDRASRMRAWSAIRRIRQLLGPTALEESHRVDGIMARQVTAYRLSHEAYHVVLSALRGHPSGAN